MTDAEIKVAAEREAGVVRVVFEFGGAAFVAQPNAAGARMLARALVNAAEELEGPAIVMEPDSRNLREPPNGAPDG